MASFQCDQDPRQGAERGHSQYLQDSQRIEARRSGFDINACVPKLRGTVDFETLVVGPAMTSLSGLGASATTGVHGLAKSTSWEDDVWVVSWLGVV